MQIGRQEDLGEVENMGRNLVTRKTAVTGGIRNLTKAWIKRKMVITWGTGKTKNGTE